MKIHLQELTNPFAIKQLMLYDNIHQAVILDSDMDNWIPNPQSGYYCVYKDDSPMGILVLERFCSNALMYHGGIFEAQRHNNTGEFLKALFTEIKELSNNKKLFTTILTTNEPALKAVKKAGFKELCVLKEASVKGDMILLSE